VASWTRDGRLSDIPPIGPARSLAFSLVCAAYDQSRRRRGVWPPPPISDAELAERAVARLEATGQIEYTGEFGDEITTFVPFVHWLKSQNRLAGRRIVTYRGMRPYYYFLDDAEYSEKRDTRHWIVEARRDWPSNNGYLITPKPWHVFPDFRARYAAQGRTFDRPVLFIQNKFTVDWGTGPVNFLPLFVLEHLFRAAADRFDIVYSRPRPLRRDVGYTVDHNTFCDYPDFALARRFENVFILEDHCEATGAPYNLTKLEILAKCHVFVAAHGGGANLIACFNKAIVLLYEQDGMEYPFSYMRGHYKHYARPAPTLLYARSRRAVRRGLAVMDGIRVEGDEVYVAPEARRDLMALRI
jgi:hypothetical protein